MGYEKLEGNLDQFDETLSRLGVKFEADSLIKKDFETAREFLGDRTALAEPELRAKWDERFKEFYHSQIVVSRLTDAVRVLRGQANLKSRLTQVLGGSLTQDFRPEASKDYFYELELAALWKECGFEVDLAEPDVVISGNGLSGPLGVACKYPSSWKQIHDHVSKGYRQITRHGYEGLVAIGLEQLVCDGMVNYLDFRQNEKSPLQIMERATSEMMTNLIAARARDYPAELPIDGLMLTMSAVGILGNPPQLASAHYATLQCDQNNPRYSDFGVLYRAMSTHYRTGENRL
ncbi:MAG: hypothetical protein JSS49_27540 [Planctomycetes bacterium]|nr:hypothetical protein [Planctomycetota bacterium]